MELRSFFLTLLPRFPDVSIGAQPNITTMTRSKFLKYDPVEDTPEYKAIEEQVEREIQEELGDEPQVLGFCHRYWSVKRAVLARHGIEWRSPAAMNPRVMFD